MYKKIKINGRFTPDSLFKKTSSLNVQIFKEAFSTDSDTFISLRMNTNKSKFFTVYFNVKKQGAEGSKIKYVSGKETAEFLNSLINITSNNPTTNTSDVLKQKVVDKLESDESIELLLDNSNLLPDLIISDDTGVDTYKFYSKGNKHFFNDLYSLLRL